MRWTFGDDLLKGSAHAHGADVNADTGARSDATATTISAALP